MRIVFDTKSKAWAVFKRWLICICIWFVMIVISSVISKSTGWDVDFFQGYFSALIVAYMTGEKKL